MNLFSNIGITELIFILLLALLVVGPERLPEMGRKLAKLLRDIRQIYENLTRDLGPELMSIQQTTQEIRQSVESVRSIPQDMVKTVIKAADLDETVQNLQRVTGDIEQIGQVLSSAGKAIQDPRQAIGTAARDLLLPAEPAAAAGEETRPAKPPTDGSAEIVP